MLRNTGAESPPEASDFLNEVLSLNAQELGCLTRVVAFALLNEVLSLNAQEFTSTVRSSVAIQSSMKS